MPSETRLVELKSLANRYSNAAVRIAQLMDRIASDDKTLLDVFRDTNQLEKLTEDMEMGVAIYRIIVMLLDAAKREAA